MFRFAAPLAIDLALDLFQNVRRNALGDILGVKREHPDLPPVVCVENRSRGCLSACRAPHTQAQLANAARTANHDSRLVSQACIGEYVGLEEIDNGVWNVFFGPLKLGRLLEEHMRIEDQFRRLKRHQR
jgi:hypothetical protein